MDYDQAAFWSLHAAERGNAAGQVDIAYLYQEGMGVPLRLHRGLRLVQRGSGGRIWARKGATQEPQHRDVAKATGDSPRRGCRLSLGTPKHLRASARGGARSSHSRAQTLRGRGPNLCLPGFDPKHNTSKRIKSEKGISGVRCVFAGTGGKHEK